jgi:O-acetyl-ADP-ribose deacetylase (regulator of RNase III)
MHNSLVGAAHGELMGVSTPTLSFIALDGDFIEAVSKAFEGIPKVQAKKHDVMTYIDARDVAFVSPANSLLFMDGGIDRAYSREMWPGVEQQCKERMKRLGHQDYIGRHFLPIGSAIVVPADALKSQWIVCAPTMLLPQPVPNTKNAFWAMLAVFRAVDKFNLFKGRPVIKHIITTAMCCGYGKMDPRESARQVREAYDVWMATRASLNIWPDTRINEPDVYFHQANMSEQPDVYENLDFKRIQ